MGYVNASTDLVTYGLPASALVNVPLATQQAQCDAASLMADGYLSPRTPTPIPQTNGAYPTDLVMRVAQIAGFMILCTRGFNPESGADVAVQMRHDLAIQWLERVQRQALTPAWIVEPTSSSYQAPNVVSGTPRGW